MSIKPPTNPNLGPKKPSGDRTVVATSIDSPSVRDSFQRVTDHQRKFTVRLDANLHKRFKTAAAVEEVNMGVVVEQLIAQWLTDKGH